ncbi:MAG: dephospho-CoA kinase, partial [Casimicrobiaceae bacterium]
MTLVVGLTGGIGSGKSAVADAFAALGVEIVDADVLAHRLAAPGQPGYDAIRARLPDVALLPGGEIDRARLRRRVFADAAAR